MWYGQDHKDQVQIFALLLSTVHWFLLRHQTKERHHKVKRAWAIFRGQGKREHTWEQRE